MFKILCFGGYFMLAVISYPDSKNFKGIYLSNIMAFFFSCIVLGIMILLAISDIKS